MKTKKLGARMITWIVFFLLITIGMYFFYGYIQFQNASEMINEKFRLLAIWILPMSGWFAFSGFVTCVIIGRKQPLMIWFGSISSIIFAIAISFVIFSGPLNHMNDDAVKIGFAETKKNVAVEQIITKSGSQWTATTTKDKYCHIVKYGESLEYIFNDITLSLQKAQEQHFNISKKNESGKSEIVPVANYNLELQRKTFLYSDLQPGDTVYLLKHELEKFRAEKYTE